MPLTPDTPPSPTASRPRSAALLHFLRRFWPQPLQVDGRERLRACLGAGLGIALTGLLTRWADPALPWLAAPLGASAVLVFAVPASPLAQPWSVIGGNTLSALVGVACAALLPDPALAGALAVALAMGLMFALRCLHPPGGATALLAAMSAAPLAFALRPMLLNSVLLVLAGVAYNQLTRRAYPQPLKAPAAAPARSRFSAADLDAALAHYNQVIDVSRDDLQALLHHAEAAAYERNFGQLRCADIMTPAPITASAQMPLREAWALMRQHRIKALPVVDGALHITGIVTVADFMRHADLDAHEGLGQRLRALVRARSDTQPRVVGEIMVRQVRVASATRHLAELVPLFSEGGHHHIPIIDARQKLVGILTQSDLVKALYRATRPGD